MRGHSASPASLGTPPSAPRRGLPYLRHRTENAAKGPNQTKVGEPTVLAARLNCSPFPRIQGCFVTDTISTYEDARYWRDRAEEMRMVAEGMESEQNKKVALRLAADYDRLAMHAERRARRSLQRTAQSPFPRIGLT